MQPSGTSLHKRKSKSRRYSNSHKKPSGKPLPKIFFCGDPHGSFDHINEAAEKHRPDAMVILGDLQPYDDVDKILARAMAVTQIWWIPGNHDSDTEEFYDRLWHGPLASRNLHGKVVNVAGMRIAGLGGVFRGQIWMPDEPPSYTSPYSFIYKNSKANLWRGGLPRRHRTSIFPSVYDNLAKQQADILVTHEAPGCHKKGFEAIDRLMESLKAGRIFHGHQHEDISYGKYKSFVCHGVGYRGIVDIEGRDIVKAQIDPRDVLVMQFAGAEPPPAAFDSMPVTRVPDASVRVLTRNKKGGQTSDQDLQTALMRPYSVVCEDDIAGGREFQQSEGQGKTAGSKPEGRATGSSAKKTGRQKNPGQGLFRDRVRPDRERGKNSPRQFGGRDGQKRAGNGQRRGRN